MNSSQQKQKCIIGVIIVLFTCSRSIVVKAQENDGFFICEESGRPIPIDYVCDGYEDCSDGADEFDCGSAFRCETYEFQCSSIDICVNMIFKCDGHNHCPDGSDEEECGLRDCKEWEYTCGNGQCVPVSYFCDGYDDCGDNSDEASCAKETCNPETEWACRSDGMCIAKNWRCDYEKDCHDGSDEEGCMIFNHRCGAGLFNCSQSECISANKLCDGVEDCLTNVGADEDSHLCDVLDCGHGKFACPEKCLEDEDSVCDGVYDCMDGSDEIGCASSCSSNQFQCVEGRCIDLINRCNEIQECLDGSDEFLCSSTVILNCSYDEYLCEDKLACIPNMFVCDGTEQCGDGSDESFCSHNQGNSSHCAINNGGCEHKCNYNDYTHYCSCNNGYYIHSQDRKSCIDVDECDIKYGICNQHCTNTNGSYVCSCADGYVDSEEHDRCKATGPALSLFFTNWFDIQYLNVRTGQLNVTISDLRSAIAVDYHYSYGLIFWSDINSNVIMRARFDGTDKRIVADLGIKRPEGIAIDWLNDRIYWTDNELNRVEVADIDGKRRAVLFSGLQNPRDIVVDPINRILFWTEAQKIVKAPLDGSNRMDFLSDITNYISWPTGLALDLPSNTLYWVDAGTRSIGSCRTDGKHLRLLYSGNITYPFGITVFEENVFWTDRSLGGIYSVNRITGKSFRKVLKDIYKPLDIVGVHPLKQPQMNSSDLMTNQCTINNGGCDYLCLTNMNNYSCHCPAFRNLLSDHHSCSRMNLFLLFSMTDRIHVLSFDNTNRYDTELSLGQNNTINSIVSLDWDSESDVIFWGDSSKRTINSLSLNGSLHNVLVNIDVSYPSGMAVDWVSRKLYWTDASLGRLYMSELDGSSSLAIVTVEYGELTDIVVHPFKGLLFYGVRNDNNKRSYIRQANLDGTNDRKFEGDFDINMIPSLFTIDYDTDRLYWIDSVNTKLHSAFINGSDHELLHDSGILYKSKGLTGDDNYLYWSDEVDGSIHQIEKLPPYEIKTLISNRQDLKDITLFHRHRQQPVSHPCLTTNGGCSHLCTGILDDDDTIIVSCLCPTGFLLGDDGKTCSSDIDEFILFSSQDRIGIVSLDIHSNVDKTIPIFPKSRSILSVDYDLKNDYVYWIEEGSPIIYRAPTKGGKREVAVQHGLIRPTALAVDWLGGNLYFSDSGTMRLEVCRLDGSSRKVLASDNNVGEVLSIVLDLNSQYIFWSCSLPSPQVFRALMDGSNPMTIIHSSDITYPVSLAIDNRGASSKLFVADSAQKRIKIFNSDGKGQVLFYITDSPIAGLAVNEDYVYWVDGDTGILHRTFKHVVNPTSERINVFLQNVFEIRLIRKSHMLDNSALSVQHACNEDICSNLCLPNWDLSRYLCACPTGIKDQTKCPPVPSIYFIFSTSNSIRRLSLEGTEYYDVVLVPELERVSYIDYHLRTPTEGRLYWSDPTHNSIMYSNLDGTMVEYLTRFKKNVRGLSVDWITGNVYYIDAGIPSIEVIDQTGAFNKVIINKTSGLGDPVDMTILPSKGYLFWIEWGKNLSRIMRARMDGSNIETLLKLYKQKPTQLTSTPIDGYIYWVDANNGTLQKIQYDGTRYEFVWKDIGQPFGMAVYDHSIFWSDVFEGTIYRCNIHSNTNQKRLQYIERSNTTPKGIAVVSTHRNGEIDGNISASSCGYNNGGCMYLCIPITQYERKCVCPNSQTDCIEYTGIHSWSIVSSSITNTLSTTHVAYTTTSYSSVVSYITPSSETHEAIGQILDNVSISVLILTGIILIAIICVLCFLLILFWKYKKLNATTDGIASSKSQFNPNKSLMVNNALYDKIQLDSKNDTVSTDPIFEPRYQLNNTVELQTKNQAVIDEFKSRKVRLPENDLKIIPKVMNDDSKEVPVFEGPEEYQITPVQSRRCYSTTSTPPLSPTIVPITVHYPTSSPNHKPIPPPPVKGLKPAISSTSPTKGIRHVQFASTVKDPPPVPPRIRLSSFSSSSSTSGETALLIQQSTPPPLSAPPTSPPLTFFQDDMSPPLAQVSFSARNPIFRRFSSSSSENDINGMQQLRKDSTATMEESGTAMFASDGEIFYRQ